MYSLIGHTELVNIGKSEEEIEISLPIPRGEQIEFAAYIPAGPLNRGQNTIIENFRTAAGQNLLLTTDSYQGHPYGRLGV